MSFPTFPLLEHLNGLTHCLHWKVDLTAYVEKHEFCFDAVLDEHVTNDEVSNYSLKSIT